MSLYSVTALLILDHTGKRIFAKYYSPPHDTEVPKLTLAEQLKFEKGLFEKTSRQNNDILIYDNELVVYKALMGPKIYMVCPPEENEAMMFQALMGIRDALDVLLESQTDRDALMANYDRVTITIDESIDNGILLESEFNVISSRVTQEANEEPSLQNIDFTEKGLRSMFGFAREKLSQVVKQQLT
ncbi:putative coatomer subunit zeta [Wickerhamiella sorbophila]|uniref:Coatomer subunit zeta n=1 Tax=Wickerhamiella sorbophila TaxID=45607 RepID=A0A2T0FBQ4_9ASCO|nr:putative coatomer subunit zeta [Wickerhamiella sorbophila]PRT52442.1 putative coatomer subunit zeta [Wickerhamiella sorbophila]